MGMYQLSLFLLGLVATGIAERVTLTRIHVDKSDHATRERRSGHLMPQNLQYRMVDANGLFVVLNLTKIRLPATTVIKNGQSFEFFASGEDVATYTDNNRDGIFMLGLRRDNQGAIRYELIGTFQFGNRRVSINPDPENRNIYNIENDDGIVDYRGDSIYPPGNAPVTNKPRQARALTNYIIEVCFLADFAIYQKFLSKNNNDVVATQTEMSTYYAFHAEQLRVRYKTVQVTDPAISISIVNSGLVIYTDPADIPYVENNKVDDTINSSLILAEFRDYMNSIPAGITIPDSDHYMLFSGYDLFSGSSGSLSNAGLAYTNVMCSTYTMSLVEDRRRERSAITAAHELAHGLGSRHDSDEGCDNADQYVMTAVSNIGAITSTEIAKRRWTFSSCSVAAFKRSLEGKECLFDNRYGAGELSASPKLGQIYSKDDQCKFAVADNSSFYGVDAGEDCYKMKCLTSATSLTYVLPLDYSDCETDKWCVHGECVVKPATEPPANQAPTLNNLPTTHDVAENENGVVFTVSSTDPESDTIAYSYKWNSPNNADTYFDFNTETGEVSIKPGVTLDYSTLQNVLFSVTVTATDDQGGASSSEELILRITQVAPLNNVPVIPNTVTTVQIAQSVPTTQTIFDVDVTDADPGDSPTFTASWVNPTNGGNFFDFNPTTGIITKKPGAILTPGQTYTVQVTASDGKDTSAPKNFNIEVVADPNTPPTITNPANPGQATVTLSSLTPTGQIFDFNAVDAENDAFNFQVSSWTPTSGGTYFDVNPTDGTVSVKPGVTLPPSSSFTLQVTATDSKSAQSSPATLIINTPAAVNQPPFLINPPNSGTESVSLPSLTSTGTVFDFNGVDPEGNPVQYVLDSVSPTTALTYFTLNPSTGEITRTNTPLPPSSTFTLKVKVSDGSLESSPGTVVITTPAAPNVPPFLTTPSLTAFIPPTATGLVNTFNALDPNGDSVTYVVDGWSPASGSQLFYLNPQTGDVTVKPGAVLPPGSTYTLNVKATDGVLSSNIGTLVINVEQAPNDPPVFDLPNYTATIPVSKVGAIVTVNADDPNPGDSVQYSVGNWNPIDGNMYFVMNPTTGVISVRPGASLPPNRLFEADISATDGVDSATSSISIITTEDPNTAPVITNLNDVIVIRIDTPPGVIFTVQSTDEENDAVTYTGTWDNQIAANIFTFNPQTGEVSLKFTPLLQLYLNTQFTLTVTASDGQLSSDPKTLTVRITQDANTPPRITNLPDEVSVMENPNGAKFFTVQASDPENDNIVFTGTWEPSWAQYYFSFDANTGEVSSKPSSFLTFTNFANQIFKLKVTAADLYGTSTTETLTFKVSPSTLIDANHPPQFSSLNYFATVMGRQPRGPVYQRLDEQVTDEDPGDTKTFSLQNTLWASYFDIDSTTGAITFTTDPRKNLADLPNQLVVTVDVTDNVGDKDSAGVLINIRDQDIQLPGFPNLPADGNVPEGSSGTVFEVEKPPVSQTLTYSMTSSPANAPFRIDPTTGVISYSGATPLDFESPDNKVFTLSVKATDINGASTPTEKLTLTVSNVNERPVFTQQRYQVTANAGQVGQVVVNSLMSSVNDPDANDYIRFQIIPGPNSNYFSINPNTGAISYAQNTAGASLPNPIRLTVQATDARGLSSTALVEITVNTINGPPSFLNLPATKPVPNSQLPGSPIFDVNAQDPEGSTLTYSISNQNSFPQILFTINPSSGVVSLKNGYSLQTFPQQNVDLLIEVSDGSQATVKPLTLTIGAVAINQPPVFNTPFIIDTVEEGSAGSVVYDAGLATDPNGDPITYTLAGSPGFTIDGSTGVIRYSQDYYLNSGRPANVFLSVTASDPSGLGDEASVFLTIRRETSTPLEIINLPGIKVLNRQGNYPVIFTVETSGGSGSMTFRLQNDFGVYNINSNTGELSLKPGQSLYQFGAQNHSNILKVLVSDGNVTREGELRIIVF